MCTCRASIVKTFRVILVILNFHGYETVRFLYQPTDHSAVEGKRVLFTCIFRHITDDMEGKYDIIWTKNSYIIHKPINGIDLDRFRFHNEYAGRRHRLCIDPVKRDDGGEYKCHFQYGGEILLTSKPGILTIREIPRDEYPLVKLGNSTYRIGEEVMICCLCEKTNPVAELEWLRPSNMGIRLTTNPGENNTHVWIEAKIPATLKFNGVYFECRLKVEDEIAPRYSFSTRLNIIDGSELLKTTSKETSRQTQQQYVTHSLSTDNTLYASKAENDKPSAKGYVWVISITVAIVLTLIPIALVIPKLLFHLIKKHFQVHDDYLLRKEQ